MPSQYAKYIKEREGRDTIENDKGFATYCFIDNMCYIVDVFVEQEHRKRSVASALCDDIAMIAREKGLHWLITTVDASTQGTSASILAILGYGFELYKSDEKLIYFRKEL